MREIRPYLVHTVLSILLCFLSSCGGEEALGLIWLDYKAEGITFDNHNQAIIPSEGLCFKIQVFKKNLPSSSVCMAYYYVDNKMYSPEESMVYLPDDKPYYGSNDWLEGDWGKYDYLDIKEQYIGEVKILPNPYKKNRKFTFFYMEGDGAMELNIVQQASETGISD
ncbi:MAG: hypothetical protein HDS97_07665 [Bacteroidales bacterium]|nr:hypothetical protein [Bacteroidales bacterium]